VEELVLEEQHGHAAEHERAAESRSASRVECGPDIEIEIDLECDTLPDSAASLAKLDVSPAKRAASLAELDARRRDEPESPCSSGLVVVGGSLRADAASPSKAGDSRGATEATSLISSEGGDHGSDRGDNAPRVHNRASLGRSGSGGAGARSAELSMRPSSSCSGAAEALCSRQMELIWRSPRCEDGGTVSSSTSGSGIGGKPDVLSSATSPAAGLNDTQRSLTGPPAGHEEGRCGAAAASGRTEGSGGPCSAQGGTPAAASPCASGSRPVHCRPEPVGHQDCGPSASERGRLSERSGASGLPSGSASERRSGDRWRRREASKAGPRSVGEHRSAPLSASPQASPASPPPSIRCGFGQCKVSGVSNACVSTCLCPPSLPGGRLPPFSIERDRLAGEWACSGTEGLACPS
jgi:hypothetical protein